MYHQVTLLGRLGGEVERRETPTGKAVASFSLAVDKGRDKTLWVRVTCWEQTAELAAQYLAKGRQVLVVGELEEPRVYQAQNGEQRASLDVTARRITFVGSRQDAEATQPLDVTVDDAELLPF